jgi:hypothetical protein
MSDSDTVIHLTLNGMGEAEQALQHRLIGIYLKLLDEHNILPARSVFYTEGVHLEVTG